jgi:hypothetical protein
MTFTMGRQILVEMARSFHVAPSRYTGGDRLDHDAFVRLEHKLIGSGFSWETAEAEELLAALRATYEPLLDGLGLPPSFIAAGVGRSFRIVDDEATDPAKVARGRDPGGWRRRNGPSVVRRARAAHALAS